MLSLCRIKMRREELLSPVVGEHVQDYDFNSVQKFNEEIRYLVAVRNTRTGIITVLPTPKTPHILSRTVKALKSISPSAAPTKAAYLEAKTTLGETFGTKKQKANIRAVERNRIDVSAMEGVMDYVIEGIEKGAVNLMTEGSLFGIL